MKKHLTTRSSAAGWQLPQRVGADALRDLDLSKIPVDSHWPELLRAFDAVGPGQSLAVVGVQNCGQTLRQLQAQRPAACESIALSQTEVGTRVELRRRSDSQRTSVLDHFESDHQRLHTILAHIAGLLRTGELPVAREHCERFKCGVDRHMQAEESVLFPLMEEAYGLAVGAKTVMGAEHGMIRELTASLVTLLQSARLDVCISATHELSELIARHSMKEEQILYPMIDRWIGDQNGRRELVINALGT